MPDPATYRPATGEIPDAPGVYRFSDPSGRVIYVGKAKSLRSRLNSYFQDLAGLHPRTRTMVTTAAGVDWTLVSNEVEALQLEYTWIKEFDPRFNVRFRDDKSYPWLAITVNEEVPRVMVVRGARRKGVRYFGPYTHVWAIRETVDLLLRVFPMRSCSPSVYRRAQRTGRPCLLADIGKCSAPCVGRVSVEQHRIIVDDFISFISGRTTPYVRRLQREMATAAKAMEYEKAAKLRDDITALERALAKNAIVFGDGTDADVISLAEDPLEVAVQIFSVRGGRIRGQRGWIADIADDADGAALVEAAIVKLYESEPPEAIPREILVPIMPTNAAALTAWLNQTRGAKTSLRVPKRGDKRELMATVRQNATQSLARHKTKRSGDLTTRSIALDEIREALGLDTAPLRIECFDISNLQGTQIVASMVVFEDGLPKKSEYKRFTLRIAGQNDVASMEEVITRRFERFLKERAEGADAPGIDAETGRPRRFAYAPSLVVVDGGAPQVAGAARAMERLGLEDIALCGLAKRLEEVWLRGEADPVILPRSSEGLYLLQRVRDEAHRFAITHHRGRRTKSMVESVLDDVPGLGAVRRKALLHRFGSVKKLRAASVSELAEVEGIGPATALSIATSLASHNTQSVASHNTQSVASHNTQSVASHNGVEADDKVAAQDRMPTVDMATGEILEDS